MVEDNIIIHSAGVGIYGGFGTASAHAMDNTVTATVARNLIRQTTFSGIAIGGGADAADDNDVNVTLQENRVTQTSIGLNLFAGSGNGGQVPTGNSLTATVASNRVCRNREVDIVCSGGTQPEGPPVGSGLGVAFNEASATIDANMATAVAIDPGCTAVPTNGFPCACPGDCDVDGHTRVDELVLSVRRALDTAAPGECIAADSDLDDTVRIDDLVRAVNTALHGCVQTPLAPA